MTDITVTTPVADSRVQPQQPKLSVGATMGAMARGVGQAFEMAYVAPYQMGRRPWPNSTQAEDGRDPAW